ncbi:hypothetical protein BHM03_00042949, partial [Ensete ventricosum]
PSRVKSLLLLKRGGNPSTQRLDSEKRNGKPIAPKKEKAPAASSKPAKSGGGKQKKKVRSDSWAEKWSKGKQKEKVNNAILFDQASYDKMLSEVPKYKQITPSVLSERLRVKDLYFTLLDRSNDEFLLRILRHSNLCKVI